MAVSSRAQAVDGVQAALVAMATQLNLELLDGLGLAAPTGAGEHDLLVAIKAADSNSLSEALAIVDEALTGRPGWTSELGERDRPPRTTGSAARRVGPRLALISVPGQYAFAEAMDALNADCDVMIFSDNVPVEQEVKLKEVAAERDLLVMGPDCGTAIVGGVGLGFANSVRRGPVGVVAASGTGAQQLTCLLELAGVGVSAVLGVGGRDLSRDGRRSVGPGRARWHWTPDPATGLMVLLSKPPASRVAAELREFAATLGTEVQFALVGPGQPDLTEIAEGALRSIGAAVPDWPRWPPFPQAPDTQPGQARPADARRHQTRSQPRHNRSTRRRHRTRSQARHNRSTRRWGRTRGQARHSRLRLSRRVGCLGWELARDGLGWCGGCSLGERCAMRRW